MKKRNRILLIGLLAVVLGGFAWLAFRQNQPEPFYQGKPLSFWLAGYDGQSYAYTHPMGPPGPTSDEANAAIRQIGTNAVPTLLRMLQQRHSRFKVTIMGLLHSQHLIRIPYASTNPNFRALSGFETLGATATDAVPLLIELFDRDPSPFPQEAVPVILGYIGPAGGKALPALLRAITHTNELVRNNAIFGLVRVEAEPKFAVPVLIKCLNDPSALVRAHAARALGALGKDAQSAIPALLELWRKEPPGLPSGSRENLDVSVAMLWSIPTYAPPDVGGDTSDALRSIDPEAAAKAGVK
jgi:hypothetical protein